MQRILGAIGLSVLLKRAAIEQVDADVPEVVFLSARAERLNDLAWALAAEARDDPAAVRELRVAAGRRGERHLRAAAAAVRVLDLVKEERTHNLANRLLLAAAVNAAVAPLTEEEGKLLDDLEALRRLPLEEAFDRLVHREPALEPLQDRLAALARDDEVVALDANTRDDLLWDRILGGLEPILGPGSSASDPITRSRTAFGLARLWLAHISGARLFDDDQ